jgi:hypothetical protein
MSLNAPPLLNLAAAVVTGGSSGLGEAFIRLLGRVNPAVPVCNLSRRPCAEKTGETFQSAVHHIPCDLADAAALARAADAVAAWLAAAPAGPVLLVNNAGLGSFGRFPGDDPGRQLAVIDVNVRAVVHLTARLLPVLRLRGGGVLNVASVVAYQPTPYAAVYGASKAFLLSWSLAVFLIPGDSTLAKGLLLGMEVHPIDRVYQANRIRSVGVPTSMDEFMEKLSTVPLRFQPGTAYQYSLATDACGALVEKISGQAPFLVLLKDSRSGGTV